MSCPNCNTQEGNYHYPNCPTVAALSEDSRKGLERYWREFKETKAKDILRLNSLFGASS